MRIMRSACAAVAAAALLGAAACGGSSSGSAGGDDTFDVVFVGGITGPYASNAAQALEGTHLAAEMLNAKGGIGGRHVEVTELNSQGDPTTAVSVLQGYMADGKKPDAVYAGVTSTETLAMLPMLTRAKVFSYSNTNNPQLNDPKSNPYHFGAVPTAIDQLAGLADELGQVKAKRIGILVPNDAFGKGEAATVEATAKKAGIPTSTRLYDAGAVDLTVPFQAVLSESPDAMFIDGADVQEARVLSARPKVGAGDMPTFGGSGFVTTPPRQVASADAVQNLKIAVEPGLVFKPADQRSEAMSYLLEHGGFLTEKPEHPSAYVTAIGFDGLRMVARLAEQAGATDGDALKKAAESFHATPDDQFVTQPDRSYSPTNHFPTVPFDWIPAESQTLTDGMYQVAAP